MKPQQESFVEDDLPKSPEDGQNEEDTGWTHEAAQEQRRATESPLGYL